MKLTKLFSRKPSWQFDSRGTVWKLLCADTILLGDTRDLEKHTSSFFALDIQSGNVLWKDAVMPQAWWIGMQQVIGETLLLHGFEKPDMPIPKGITAVDIKTGTPRWNDPELTFLFSANHRVYAQRASLRDRTFYEIDPQTGAELYDYGGNEEGVMQLRAVAGSEDEPGYVFAESLQYFDAAVQQRLTNAMDLNNARGVVDVALFEEFAIVAYHEPAKGAAALLNNRVTNRMKIVGTNGGVVYEDTLVEDAPAPVPDVFFIKDGVLLYVKEGAAVRGLRLRELQG